MIVSSYDSDTPRRWGMDTTIFGHRISVYLANVGRHSKSTDGGKTFTMMHWGHWRLGITKVEWGHATDGMLKLGPVRMVWMSTAHLPRRKKLLQATAN